MISPSTIERIKEIPILEVVQRYVEAGSMKKTGATWRGKSPFTEEKTPSFFVIPAKNIFKDFSSGKGGNSITFVMEKTGLGFVEAIRDICDKTGERIEWEISEKPTQDQKDLVDLFSINRAAARRFNEALLEIDGTHPAFKDLIDRRGFSADTIIQWQIGWAPTTGEDQGQYNPSAWKFLTSVLLERGLVEPAKKLGLIQEKNGDLYDAFRNRIIFPIHDHLGRIAGFGGRHVAPDTYNPKYLNSQESATFDKKRILFGLHFASQSIKTSKYAYLMEGYTDVISFHQAGYQCALGTCGTALSDEQCRLLKRFCDKVVLFPDPDDAGEKSALRSVDILMRNGFETAIVPMPVLEGHSKIDPDELVRMFVPQMVEG